MVGHHVGLGREAAEPLVEPLVPFRHFESDPRGPGARDGGAPSTGGVAVHHEDPPGGEPARGGGAQELAHRVAAPRRSAPDHDEGRDPSPGATVA